ncbi:MULTISPECIES: hypothetical protein [Nostoc]|uniref:Uncharacterized protein n=1 Tax=Nostoc paludosum FACHB-159 TaxID=2692908 RepID=A0ABR8KDR5_9NOSO|nr:MULTISPECIES: hypothetical protein [Nostoc]MBD2680600.1 hypothetical protein [Nostoc sp. FACHB-857]MBD2736994.1 hypothetical protein [Nostoc paludosum FACHB-159]
MSLVILTVRYAKVYSCTTGDRLQCHHRISDRFLGICRCDRAHSSTTGDVC